MVQEHNIRNIKDTYRPEGPNSIWAYPKKISPAIPSIKAIGEHVETESDVLSRGKKHGVPDFMEDVTMLEKAYRISELYIENTKCRLPKGKKYTDYVNDGLIDIQSNKYLAKWNVRRNYKQYTEEMWSVPTEEIIDAVVFNEASNAASVVLESAMDNVEMEHIQPL